MILGEAELERQLARKSPVVIWFTPAATHRCQLCGHAGYWAEGWVAWDRYKDRYELRGDGTDVYCSINCAKAQNPQMSPPSWMNVTEEPLPVEQRRQLRHAQRRDSDAQAGARKAVRGVPLPEWRGNGWCKWCGEEIADKRRSSWHKGCVRTYWLHCDLTAQTRFLRERDGSECAWPGCHETRGLEVDHRWALWKVAHLPPDERRWYFGPGNLWRICPTHHKRKTRLEAQERAEQRRLARQSSESGPDLFSG